MRLQENVPLANYTTLELGGAARYFVCAASSAELIQAVEWAADKQIALRILGGGSNLVVADAGFSGLVIQIGFSGFYTEAKHGKIRVVAEAGQAWDALVQAMVERNYQGIECLSGIPGLVGATPIQNVGAYGQEIASVLDWVEVLDLEQKQLIRFSRADCDFGYRTSRFKTRDTGRYVVLRVAFELVADGAAVLRYAELERAFGNSRPSLSQVRNTVLNIRATKSMLLDKADPNHRSCGSFFVNPVVETEQAAEIAASAAGPVPRYAQPNGREKLSAAWLIENSGFSRGFRAGNVGISSKHALALVCHNGANTEELLAFAERIVLAVKARFGVDLEPEPVVWGA